MARPARRGLKPEKARNTLWQTLLLFPLGVVALALIGFAAWLDIANWRRRLK